MKPLLSLVSAWNRYWFAPKGALELAMIRITFFGYLYRRYAWPKTDWKLLRDTDFWKPVSFFKHGVPVLDYEGLQLVYALFSLGLLFSALGLFTRVSTWVAFLTGMYVWGLKQNFGKYTGGGVDIIIFVVGAFALSRSGDYLSVDSWLKKAGWNLRNVASATKTWFAPPPASAEYRWPIRFAWLMFFILYTSAGISKLTDTGLDWALSENLRNLLIRHHYSHVPPTELGLWLAESKWAYQGMGLATLFFESLCLLGMFSGWLRLVFVGGLLGMQYGVAQTLGVRFSGVAVLAWIFVPWEYLFNLARSRLGKPAAERAAQT